MMIKKDTVLHGEAMVLGDPKRGNRRDYPFFTKMGGEGFNFLYFTKKPLEAVEGDIIDFSGWQEGTEANLFVFELLDD